MKPSRILFVVSEVDGLAKSGGLADVGYALPKALATTGVDVRIVCPYYRQIREQFPAAKQVAMLNLSLPGRHYQCRVLQLTHRGLTVYAIDYPAYFDRAGLYDDGYQAYADNGHRFALFSLASLELARAVNFQPDIVHCNDWQTGLLPLFLKQRYAEDPFFAKTRSVLSLHNAAYQGLFQRQQLKLDAEIPDTMTADLHRDDGLLNMLQCGVLAADKLVAVSPQYAEELKTPLGSHGLYLSFVKRADDLVGILNGCDYASWDPAADPLLPANYHAGDLAGKAVCKRQLQRQLNLPQDEHLPLFAMVCRLTDQKGLTLLLPVLEQMREQRLQVAIIGTGDPVLCLRLKAVSKALPDTVAFYEGFSQELAHLAYAGSDFFLMPSLYEPCGLAQMYALAYGSLPVVREVGGLKDTVSDYDQDPLESNGFSFDRPAAEALERCMIGAMELWHTQKPAITSLQQRAMGTRFTWQESMQKYLALYRTLIQAEKRVAA